VADFSINVERVINSSQDIMSIANGLKQLTNRLEGVKVGGGMSRYAVEQAIKKAVNDAMDEAAKMSSMSDALQVIASKYREVENKLSQVESGNSSSTESAEEGTDKRNWWNKFWDWVMKKEPDEYDATSDEQEKAADEAMKRRLWNVLQDEKYSPSTWDNASIEERKQILQDYMNEVIRIYGLQDVNTKIVWDSDATYTANSITWGYYTHGRHRVTLNEQALADNVGSWDSYELLGTVAHELRHAYQHEAVDHPTRFQVSQETIDIWRNNFRNYISSDDGYEQYRQQPVEVDAREFEIDRNDSI